MRIPALALCVALLTVSCGSLKGEFAMRKAPDDTYRKIHGSPEFAMDDEIQWVYSIAAVRSTGTVGVLLMKKEIVWVEVSHRNESVNPQNRVVYGIISGLPEGHYRLVLNNINKGRMIDELYFSVYAP